MPEQDPWLRDAIKTLSTTVETVRVNQESLLVSNAERLAKMEGKIEMCEHRVATAQRTIKQEARRWGAIGGAGSGLLAVVAVALKAVFGVK